MTLEHRGHEALKALRERAMRISAQPRVDELGHVRRVGDGVAIVDGLPSVALYELVVFENGTLGQVLSLDRASVGCVLLGSEQHLEAGSPVYRTGTEATVPVGEAVLGRVIDPLGSPLDGQEPLRTSELRGLEQEAPGPLAREPVREPLLTGIKVIDAAIPIGRGQRQLILGDRRTGKTSIAIDTVIRQASSGVVCVYVSIGGKRVVVKEVIEELSSHGALAHTVVVVADAGAPASLRYLAPYAGCSIAEWFAYHGQHALIVYDDLTRHAEAYRDLSLLLRNPPGREAYPGDIFFVQAKLMERAFKLSADLGGGSVTALPIVETQRGNYSSFIPTNLISMTDGQVYLDADLFAEGQLPAVDVGKSVSRVGGSAQPPALREATTNLRIALSQYEEVKGFARFGAILDDATRHQLREGERLAALLLQGEREPRSLTVEVAAFWASQTGALDALAPSEVGAFERALIDVAKSAPGLAHALEQAPEIDDILAGQLSGLVSQALERVKPR